MPAALLLQRRDVRNVRVKYVDRQHSDSHVLITSQCDSLASVYISLSFPYRLFSASFDIEEQRRLSHWPSRIRYPAYRGRFCIECARKRCRAAMILREPVYEASLGPARASVLVWGVDDTCACKLQTMPSPWTAGVDLPGYFLAKRDG